MGENKDMKMFFGLAAVVCLLIIFGIVAVKDDKRIRFEEAKRDSVYLVVDNLSQRCQKMDSIIKDQDKKIKSLTFTQSEIKKRLNINDKKIKDNNRIANNAIKGLAIKYAIDYYYGNY